MIGFNNGMKHMIVNNNGGKQMIVHYSTFVLQWQEALQNKETHKSS